MKYLAIRQYLIVLSRMTPLQIVWRIRVMFLQCLRRSQKRTLPAYTASQICNQELPQFGHIPSEDQRTIECAKKICQGQFSFLNQPVNFDSNLPNWFTSPDGDKLWTYNLHYFEYAYELLWAYITTQQIFYLDCLIDLISNWIDENLQWNPIAWNPYPLSKRIIIWTTLLGYLQRHKKFQPHLDKFISSLCQQAEFLFRNLEYDVDNNHLITNARALIWTGLFLPGHQEAAKWYDKGIDILAREAARQILADGGHWERSTSYQMVILQDYLETTILLQNASKVLPDNFLPAIGKQFDFLDGIIKPDGTLPLLNDSIEGYPVSVTDIMAIGVVFLERPEFKRHIRQSPGVYFDWVLGETGRRKFETLPEVATNKQSTAYQESGYYVLRGGEANNQTFLIFDCGEIGPRHSSAHAHADTLSFELFAYNQTLIVDPGVYEYQAGYWRDYFRSTAAHNTITIDELDQSVFWGSFRVAEIARAKLLNWETTAEYDYVEGEHNGYTRFSSGVIHRRSIHYNKLNQWIITDTLLNPKQGIHRYDLRFHFTPSEYRLEPEANEYSAFFPKGVKMTVMPAHPFGTLTNVEDGWISDTWKQKVSAPVLSYQLESAAAEIVFKTTLKVSLQSE